MPDEPDLAFAAATPERWADVATVIGACGDARHCWCAYWYLPNAAYRAITCFVVLEEARRQGLVRRLIEAAVDLAREHGAAVVEGYPLDLRRKAFAGELFVGTLRAFSEAGFVEVARRSPHRPIVRRVLAAE